ncbi:MAG: secretin N-terminal domain-containing protein, partial [Planctomycetota bacterium]
MKVWWLTAALLLVAPAALAQEGDEQDENSKAEREAIKKLLKQAETAQEQEQDGESGEKEEKPDPEDLRIVASQEEDADQLPAEATEMNLSGSEVDVSVLGPDSVVITANEHDLAILKALIEQVDLVLPPKELRVVKLEERPANEVASTLQQAVRDLWPRDEERPETKVSITAVSSNILLVVAPGTKIDLIVKVAQAIDDAAPEIKADMMVFTVKHRKATEAAERLTEIITELRRKQGADAAQEFTITPNDANGTIMVFGPTSERETIQRFLDEIDAEAIPGFGELKLVIFPLVNADARDLADMFSDMLEASEAREGVEETIRRLIMLKRVPGEPMQEFPPLDLEKTLKLIPHEDTNSVLVATVEENIEPVGEIIALLDDVPMSVDMGLRIFALRFADAETVAEALEEMFQEGRDLPKAAEGGQNIDGAVPSSLEGEALVYNLGIVPDLRTNTVIVSGRPVQLALVERVVAEMDQPATALKFPLRLLFLGDHIDATRIGQIIESLFEKRIEALEAQDAGKSVVERERVFLAVDIRSNSLIISASEENIGEIREIVTKLDTAPDKLIDQIRIINCQNTSAADLQSKIEDL